MAEEEVLGKAYDSRLMKRLLAYLRPYKVQVGIALTSIVLKATADVIGPFITLLAFDLYLAPKLGTHPWFAHHLPSERLVGINLICGIYVGLLLFAYSVVCISTN